MTRGGTARDEETGDQTTRVSHNPFAELGYESTLLGDLSLRRRHIATLDRDVYEVKLGDEYLMSSMFTASEEALGRLGVAAARGSSAERSASSGSGGHAGLDVVVGGLGLG